MKKSRFTETQIVSILKEADAGRPITDARFKLEREIFIFRRIPRPNRPIQHNGFQASKDLRMNAGEINRQNVRE